MRPSRDEWAMKLAMLTAQRTTCCRRAVGCVLLNERGHVIATGYNGVATGLPHCNEEYSPPEYHDACGELVLPVTRYIHACSGANAPSGTNLDGCQAIHAEQNAMLQCKNVYEIHTAYVTASPCMTCTKLLLNTSCKRIVFVEEYPHNEAQKLWESSGRSWEQILVSL